MYLGFVTLIFIHQAFGQYAYSNDCPTQNIRFEKIIGLRPDDEGHYTLLYKEKASSAYSGITENCLVLCSRNISCTNVVLFYNKPECYEYRNPYAKDLLYSDDGIQVNYLIDNNVGFFVKTCLEVPKTCGKLWPIERVPGSTLVTNGLKMLSGFYTRHQCAEKCINETEFVCRSANFRVKGRSLDILTQNVTETIGVCILNDADRHTLPNSFRVSSYGAEYIENQCINISRQKDYCSYEEYTNTVFSHVDEIHNVSSPDLCRNYCEVTTEFNCHGYSVVPLKPSYLCFLHSEDTQLLGPKLLKRTMGGQYFERARCLNLTVTCTSSKMYIKFTPDSVFQGRLYMYGHSEEKNCQVTPKSNETVTLPIDIQPHSCGITQALTNQKPNRTLLSAYVIIQYNPLIQTQGDRFVKVGCLLDNDLNNFTQNVTLGATVQFNSSLPAQGSTIINNSTVKPTVHIAIVDPITNLDVMDVQIGQEIQLRIEIQPADGPYDIWGSDLIAMSSNESFQLLDKTGCPIHPTVFPELSKKTTNSKRILYANFLAFKFPSSPIVKFSLLVHFCTLSCPVRNCTVQRFKRESPIQSNLDFYKLGPIISTNPNIIEDRNSTMMSLEYVILVRADNISSDRFVIGDGQIIIAGFDIGRNEVCFNYTLFIALLILWGVTQIVILVGCYMVIRKYKKYYDIAYDRQSLSDIHQNFGFGNTNLQRRVHWADEICPQCPHTIIK